MNKFLKFVGGSAVAASLLVAGVASAATIPATAVFEGQTQSWGNPGQSKQVTLRVNAAAGEVAHAIRTDILGDNLPTVCHDISNFEGSQEKDVTLTVTLPPNTGDYGFEAIVYSTTNVAAANALTGSAACAPSTGNTAGPALNQGGVIHVIPNGSTSGTSGTGTSTSDGVFGFTSFADFVAALKTALGLNAPTATTPAKPAWCSSLSVFTSGTFQGQSGAAVSTLQAFLINPAGANLGYIITYGATGYYGTQTAAAVGVATNTCK